MSFLKKVMHKITNDPDKVEPGKYSVISSCFSIWWKNLCDEALQRTCPSRKRRVKTPRQIRYVSYCEWALKITKFQREVTFKHYSYLEEVLNYICALVPNNVKGEISEGWYKVSLKEVWEALQNKLL